MYIYIYIILYIYIYFLSETGDEVVRPLRGSGLGSLRTVGRGGARVTGPSTAYPRGRTRETPTPENRFSKLNSLKLQ